MLYYKLFTNDEFIGVATSNNFLYENPISKWLLTSNEISGQFIQCNNKLYRDYWMAPLDNPVHSYENVQIVEIDQATYEIFASAITNNETIVLSDGDEPILSPEIIDYEAEVTIEYARNMKIKEMSKMCNATIEEGFDLALHGEMHHFSLTIQDQLNLINLNTIAQTQQLIPYHADGEVCEFYTSDEINDIIAQATAFKNYQIAYHNALKVYINALETIEDIAAITYGTPIPDEYKSDVLKILEY